MYCFKTCGKGLRQTLVAASASAFTRTSLYSHTAPGKFLLRVSQVDEFASGLSAHSGLPQSVPSQSLVWRSIWSQLMVLLCAVAKGCSNCGWPKRSAERFTCPGVYNSIGGIYGATISFTFLISPCSTARPTTVDKKLLVTLCVISQRSGSPQLAMMYPL